jgi:hypothetical protein
MCADAPPVRRRRRAVHRGRRVDRRTREAHLVSKLVADLCAQIGDAARSPLVHADIVRCAELTVLAATARAHAMRSGGTMFDAESIARIEGAADRARRRLSVPSRASGEPTLAQYLAAKEAEPADEAANAMSGSSDIDFTTSSEAETLTSEAVAPADEAAQ